MNGENVIGQTLDEKYRIESEIGKGGMGTVYLATHVGTERPVALKIIAPEFMQRVEFVERFKREARAAGRLRHPNVVNVTDFGFASTAKGIVAYLVMEYLDGCTLGEVLEEEGKLPLSWTLDILEQICSAVQEAHQQGIIHRDLKPDNIWLEPNQRGGYTVKVLDFGIAKLEEHEQKALLGETGQPIAPTVNFHSRTTVADQLKAATQFEKGGATAALPISEAGTMIQPNAANSEAGTMIQSNGESEAGTMIQSAAESEAEAGTMIQPSANESEAGTQMMTAAPPRTLKSPNGTRMVSTTENAKVYENTGDSANLTRVGAVLGTPLYMSPEQCRGEKLTHQSDIYSLGVIVYQMLTGKTPFSGDYTEVMRSHKEVAAPSLEAKKIPKKVKKVVAAALDKIAAERPPTAQAFASEMRAQSEGIGALYQRALVIYGEHIQKFIGLTILLYLPAALFTLLDLTISFLEINDSIGNITKVSLKILAFLGTTFLGMFSGYLVFGTITWLVTQILAVPLRPVKVRPALEMTRRRWKGFAGTGMLSAVLTLIGCLFCLLPGIYCMIFFMLVAPVVMMEKVRGFDALRRSRMLVKRSLRTTAAAALTMFFVPMFGALFITFLADSAAKFVSTTADKISVIQGKMVEVSTDEQKAPVVVKLSNEEKSDGFQMTINGAKAAVNDKEPEANLSAKIKLAVSQALTQLLLLPFQIFVASFSSIVVALLYMKTRQIGGESMQDLLAQFEASDQPRTNWQRRVKERIEHSGRQTSRI